MGKVKLNLDDLVVQSFHTAAEVGEEGSVFGYESTGDGPGVISPSDISQCFDPTCTETGVPGGASCSNDCTDVQCLDTVNC